MGPQIVKNILKNKNKVGRVTLPDFKTYYESTTIKTVLAKVQTYKPVEHEREYSTKQLYGQMSFDNGAKNIEWGTKAIFSIKGAISSCERVMLHLYLTTY